MIPDYLVSRKFCNLRARAGVLGVAAAVFLQINPLQAQTARYIDAQAIDTAVSEFVGALAGAPGGARQIVDRRLKLAACSTPLDVDWHGKGRDTAKVECTDAGGWRIFVAISPSPAAAGNLESAAPVIKKGDMVSIVVRGNGFSVAQGGEALEGGAEGEWIRVRAAEARDALHARVERPGLVVVPAG